MKNHLLRDRPHTRERTRTLHVLRGGPTCGVEDKRALDYQPRGLPKAVRPELSMDIDYPSRPKLRARHGIT